jgi:hypothetical protein
MRGSEKGSEDQMKLQCFYPCHGNCVKRFTWQNLRSVVQTSYTKQKHFKCTHFWIKGDEIGVPVYIKTMQSCSSTFWHQLTKFSETGWPRSACNFMFPLRSRRNAIHRNSSRLSPSELVFSLGERREEFRMMCIAH